MQGLRRYPNNVVHLDLTSPSSSNTTNSMPTNLSIDAEESTETKIQRLISEHPVIIFSRTSCCMCHVMRKLLASIGVHPTVIELDDHEISAVPPSDHNKGDSPRNPFAPAVFIGGTCVGGLESLFALHLSGHLVPKLVEVGALWWGPSDSIEPSEPLKIVLDKRMVDNVDLSFKEKIENPCERGNDDDEAKWQISDSMF